MREGFYRSVFHQGNSQSNGNDLIYSIAEKLRSATKAQVKARQIYNLIASA